MNQSMSPQPTQYMQEIIDTYAAFGAPPLEGLSPENARNLPTFTDAVMGVIGKHITKRALPMPEPVGRIAHEMIPGAEGDLVARLYYPKETANNVPVLLYFHGGGFVIANLDTYDASCRALCNESGYLVMSVGYRQAPEHPFPAASDDALCAYRWLVANAGVIGGDPNRIAICGESAGGNLATVTCIRAKEEGLPQPLYQILIYPVTDLTFSGRSHSDHAAAKPLNENMMFWFKRHYLQGKVDPNHPHVSPIFATNLEDLAPAVIITAEFDPLLSDGEIYAEHLRKFGVNVRYRQFDGVTHEFFGAKILLPESKDAISFAAEPLLLCAEEDYGDQRGSGHDRSRGQAPIHIE